MADEVQRLWSPTRKSYYDPLLIDTPKQTI